MVRYWPERAWQKFLMLWHEWCVRDCFPDNWNHCRHVMLPKDSDYCDGILPVQALRPICVQSLICRLLSSAMARRARHLSAALVSNDVHGAVQGRGLHSAILALDSAYEQNHILCSLDLAKAFDHMSAELASGFLQHAGSMLNGSVTSDMFGVNNIDGSSC